MASRLAGLAALNINNAPDAMPTVPMMFQSESLPSVTTSAVPMQISSRATVDGPHPRLEGAREHAPSRHDVGTAEFCAIVVWSPLFIPQFLDRFGPKAEASAHLLREVLENMRPEYYAFGPMTMLASLQSRGGAAMFTE